MLKKSKSRRPAPLNRKERLYQLQRLARILLVGHGGSDVLSQSDARKVLFKRVADPAALSANELQREVNLLVSEALPEDMRVIVYVEGADDQPVQPSGRHTWMIADDLMEIGALVRYFKRDFNQECLEI